MGDNRGDSADSRIIGPIPKSLFIGRAFCGSGPCRASAPSEPGHRGQPPSSGRTRVAAMAAIRMPT